MWCIKSVWNSKTSSLPLLPFLNSFHASSKFSTEMISSYVCRKILLWRPPPLRVLLPVLERVKQAYLLWHEYHSTLPKLHRYTLGEKIDILFIPQNIADISLMEPFIKKIFFNEKGAPEGRGLFNTEPFTAYKDKFNIFYAGKNLDSEYFNCYLEQQDPNGPLKWQLHQSCDNLKVQDTYKIFNPDYIQWKLHILLVSVPRVATSI